MSLSCEYDLFVRQQPQQARVCSADKLDRRPIDPPPIIQFRSTTTPDESNEPESFLKNPNYFMFASLVSPDTDITVQYLNDGKTRALNGPAVSNLWHLEDPENEDKNAGFFVFSELSVRLEGRFRLKLTLFEVKDTFVRHCKSIFSDPFCVYTPSKFPGMQVSTELSCALADQGIKIRLRHDTRARTKTKTAPTKRARDPGDQSGGRKTKRTKAHDPVDDSSTPQDAWNVIDPALTNVYAPYPPPPHMTASSSHMHFPSQHDTPYPPPPDTYEQYGPPPVPDHWDPSLQYPPPAQPWYGYAPPPAPTFESAGEEKQGGGAKADPAPRRVLRARPGTVLSTPHG